MSVDATQVSEPSSAFIHPAVVDPTDAIFVLGAAIFTSILTEGKAILTLLNPPNALFRHLLVLDLQTPRV